MGHELRRALQPEQALGARHALNSQTEHDVLRNRQMRKQRIGLKHHGHAAPRWRLARDVAAADLDVACIRQI
jgi:hypothetical protein